MYVELRPSQSVSDPYRSMYLFLTCVPIYRSICIYIVCRCSFFPDKCITLCVYTNLESRSNSLYHKYLDQATTLKMQVCLKNIFFISMILKTTINEEIKAKTILHPFSNVTLLLFLNHASQSSLHPDNICIKETNV